MDLMNAWFAQKGALDHQRVPKLNWVRHAQMLLAPEIKPRGRWNQSQRGTAD